MLNKLVWCISSFIIVFNLNSLGQQVIPLNGTWQFDQTTSAFPPVKFSRSIPVPGLVSLALPKIDEYEVFFRKPEKSEYKTNPDLLKRDYTPKYSWYRKIIDIPAAYLGKEAVLVIKKSQYVTQVYVNGIDVGSSASCFTPIILPLSTAIKYGAKNEILIKTGDKAWLPSEAAGGTDKEKEHYLPGIWDDVYLSFSDKFRINKAIFLPSLKQKTVTAKFLLRSFYPLKTTYGQPKRDKAKIEVALYEKASNKQVAVFTDSVFLDRDNNTLYEAKIPVLQPYPWSPDDPFLYTAKVKVFNKQELSDEHSYHFGIRDFERIGKHFYLNGKQTYLRGSNITLHRFFEDPDSKALAWNREWVKKMFIDYAKNLNWNTYRICVGIVPDFWYDMADEYGIMLQNEWMYWEDHGWNDEIKKEYSDWVWTDGNHPSIVIWDALNENRNLYIGSELIPQLKHLDPTRVWDAGYMAGNDMKQDEMDEPHPYMSYELRWWDGTKTREPKKPYQLGNLDFRYVMIDEALRSDQAQLVNEYGWVWTWRDGQPSKLTLNFYKYYLGNDLSAEKTRHFQAYWLQIDTEWLRCQRELAGVLSFTHLTNNYGYTGDWFSDITNLTPTPALLWFRHCFAPTAVFVNLTDERYVKDVKAHQAGEQLGFNLVGINDLNEAITGKVVLKLYDYRGTVVVRQTKKVILDALDKQYIPVILQLPSQTGGYTLAAEFTPDSTTGKTVVSRRYLKIGQEDQYQFFDPTP